MMGSRGQKSPQIYKICLKTTQEVGYISINKISEGSHPVVRVQLFIVSVPSLHNI